MIASPGSCKFIRTLQVHTSVRKDSSNAATLGAWMLPYLDSVQNSQSHSVEHEWNYASGMDALAIALTKIRTELRSGL